MTPAAHAGVMNPSLLSVLVGCMTLGVVGCCCPPRGTTAPSDAPPRAATRPTVPTLPPASASRSSLTPDQRVEAYLAGKRIKGLAWEEVDLDTAVAYLRAVSGHNFYISPSVRDEKFDDIVITARLDDVSVAAVLDVVLTQPFDLQWQVRDGVVWIVTTEEIEGPPRLRYYDVKDLAPGRIVLGGGGEREPSGKPPAGSPARDLEEEIRRKVHPSYWEREDASIELRNGILIVRARKAVHVAVNRYLTEKRRKATPGSRGAR